MKDYYYACVCSKSSTSLTATNTRAKRQSPYTGHENAVEELKYRIMEEVEKSCGPRSSVLLVLGG